MSDRVEPSFPLRKCIVEFGLHSFHSEITDELILNQQLFKKIVVLRVFHIDIN